MLNKHPRTAHMGSNDGVEVRADQRAVAETARSKRRQGVRALACLLLAASVAAVARPAETAEIANLVEDGRFAEAEARIAKSLAEPGLAPAQRHALEFERERMRRIRLDFPHDRARVVEQLRRQVPDLADADVVRWDAAGLLEHRVIDGKRWYFDRAASNLFRLDPRALARRDAKLGPLRDGPFERLHAHHAEVRAAAQAEGSSSVAPRRVRVTQSLTVAADAVPDGELVRAWIPYPREIAGQQRDITYVASEPAAHRIAPASALQRTVHFERKARRGEPTRFSVTYELTIHARDHRIDPARIVAVPADPALAEHLAERPPHVVFTPAVREFSRRAVGDASAPYEVAKRLFDAVDRIPWAGAREYSTLASIPDHTLAMGHGDCGQQTLLLITLLRLNGIPARWQSGWVYSDGDHSNLHDWGALYLAPYGWVPMDVTTGRLAGAEPGLAYFYLGGLDAYRIAMNDDWGRDFVPRKRHFRSDTVDSQRGEAEWDGGNLYYDQWDYAFDWQLLPLPERT